MRPRVFQQGSCRPWALLLVGLVACIPVGASDDLFESQIRPVFNAYCIECHNGQTRKGGLDLSKAAGVARGSEDGPVIVPGDPEQSLLLRLVREGKMPPEEETERPSSADLDRLTQWVLGGAALPGVATKNQSLDQHDILPILHLRCVTCHGAGKQEAGLDLRSVDGLLRGGESGKVVVSGSPDASLLIQRIEQGEMPPKRDLVQASVKPMRASELARLRRWIQQGMLVTQGQVTKPRAPWKPEARDFWAFQPVVKPVIPRGDGLDESRNPIDRFISQRLRAVGLRLAPEAETGVLVRRVSFDLLGLPPSLEEQAVSLQARPAPDAYDRLVDRLLASPAYGERWGRYWLDVAGYSDSEGIQHADELRPAAYRYRDYVIQALNADKPYREFITEQLAGDELVDYQGKEELDQDTYDALVATGFLRMVGDGTNANITNFVPHRLDVIANEMQVLGGAVLGLTMHCARCHSHKFDPISQRDYYQLLAVFKGAFDEHDWLSPKQRRLTQGLASEMRDWRSADDALSRRVARVKALTDLNEKEREEQIQALEGQRVPKPFIRALWNRNRASDTYLLTRGDYLNPGEWIPPEVPEFLRWDDRPLVDQRDGAGSQTMGRRLAFAKWLVDERHPLTARVIVNRVWKHHFGRGLVATLDNFGVTGSAPTHPELLDWLAAYLVERDWSLKALHRLILTSRTYRQSSHVTPEMMARDPNNALWSRMAMRRLEGEVIRDTLLQAAGRLRDEPFGPADGVAVSAEGLVTARASGDSWRRSIYVRQRRTEVPTLLQSFDLPAMSPNCVERSESTVATQALHLLNNELIHRLSASFASRAQEARPRDLQRQFEWAFATAVGRSPTDLELQSSLAPARETLAEENESDLNQARVLQAYCHALYNSAAFVYVD